MRMYDIILKKRNGNELTREEISFFIKNYTNGSIPDYQASALCMAIYFKGMTDRETVILTEEMANSGETIDLSIFGDKSVDKHSTGGVGDKTTLIVAPIVASLGGVLAKMSGRGLGHTGGTVDKLESIDGYQTTLSKEEFLSAAQKVGLCVVGQSANLAPADKKLYALRDVTATVDNIPLITSSIMSKKIAAGSKNIVLDVKTGSGAFMKTLEDAEILAKKMVEIGKGCNRRVVAVLSDMNAPLGKAVGNSLEVIEAIEVLKGKSRGDLYEVCVCLASEMISLVLKIETEEARRLVQTSIDNGSAFAKMKEWVAFQGANAELLENPELFRKAKFQREVKSEKEGYIQSMNAEEIGISAVFLGAGRNSKQDEIDHSAGIIINKKVGDYVKKGEALCTLYSNKEDAFASAEQKYLSAISLGDIKPPERKLIHKIIK